MGQECVACMVRDVVDGEDLSECFVSIESHKESIRGGGGHTGVGSPPQKQELAMGDAGRAASNTAFLPEERTREAAADH